MMNTLLNIAGKIDPQTVSTIETVSRVIVTLAIPYVIVGAFIIGMLLTPPDVISQVLLAFPMWVLFEAGLIASKIIFRDRNFDEEEDDDDEAESETTEDVADHEPLTDEEMEAELDQAETDESRLDKQ